MGFRKQLVGGIGAQIALVLLVCAIAVGTSIRVTGDASRETRHTLDDVLEIHRLRTRVDALVASARGYLLTGNDRYLAQLTTLRREIDDAMHAFDAPGKADVTDELAVVSRELRTYTSAIDEAVRDRTHITDLAALEQLYERRLSPERAVLESAITDLEETKREYLAQRMVHHEHLTRTAGIATLLVSALAIAISLGVGLLVVRRLSSQFRTIQESRREADEAAASRKELLDIVSHDLRSPLNTIVLGLDVLREEHGDLPHLHSIENAALRMQRLVNDLLDAARSETCGLELDLSTSDSRELLELALEMFARPAERAGIELKIGEATHTAVVVDRDRVLQILANLIGNALKVTPRGGSIVLAVEQIPDGVRFSVRDSGSGLADEQIPALFEAYRQGKAHTRKGSLGLGLYISNTLTRAHGGTMGVESTPQGSTFWFVVPHRAVAEQAAVA